MNFLEFNRRLEKCHLDEDTKYLLTHMFEVQMEFSKQLDLAANISNALATTLEQVVTLHGDTQDKIKRLLRGNMVDGVEVHSVRNEPEE